MKITDTSMLITVQHDKCQMYGKTHWFLKLCWFLNLCWFFIFAENVNVIEKEVNISNQGTYKSITSIVCSCLLQMGDGPLVVILLEKMVIDQMVS